MQIERKFFDHGFAIKAAGDAGLIEGMGSVYGNVDQGNDVCMPGMFAASIAEHKARGTRPVMLYHHRTADVPGKWEEFEETAAGLRLKGRFLLDTQLGRETYVRVKEGAIDGLSIGFQTERYEIDEERGVRRILQAKLLETSVVAFPMNELARVTSVKSLLASTANTLRELEEFFRVDCGLGRDGAKFTAAKVWPALCRERDAPGTHGHTTHRQRDADGTADGQQPREEAGVGLDAILAALERVPRIGVVRP